VPIHCGEASGIAVAEATKMKRPNIVLMVSIVSGCENMNDLKGVKAAEFSLLILLHNVFWNKIY
jgi:hypothetical protein